MAARGNRTAYQDGDGFAVAGVAGQSVIPLRMIVTASAASTITVGDGDPGGGGDAAMTLAFGAAGTIELGDGMTEIMRTTAGRGLHVAASAGTVSAHVAFEQR